MSEGALFADRALLAQGWRDHVLLRWTAEGRLSSVESNASAPPVVTRARGAVIPGMPNLHCHAFQRAMAGLAEHRSDSNDNFWSWRELMYRFAAKITPELMYAIARQLYIEMLKAAYTSVCEFHYVHHDPYGAPYANPGEMSESLIRAAQDVGIGLTLLPVLYQFSGFGERPPRPEQKRFGATPAWILDLIARLSSAHAPHAGLRYGIAPHSLRAVSPDSLRELVDGARSIDRTIPVHMHIAEQVAEVEECVAHTGARPVEWLLDHFEVDQHWCLVHATHMTAVESARMAESTAAAGLCPTTEANLGDGVFEAARYFESGGRWGIGSDSNVSVSVAEELRLLEYGQRLRHQRRNVLADPNQPEVGEALYTTAAAGGASASGRPIAGLAAGQRADFAVLDETHPSLVARPSGQWLGGFVFCNHPGAPLRDVFVAGQRVIGDGRHRNQQAAAEAYQKALETLLGA